MSNRTHGRKPALFTIGYEGKTVEEFITDLKTVGVTFVIDARYRPQSRKPGFSSSRLLATLAGENIKYQHRKDLGTPPELMQRKRDTGAYELDAYGEYLDGQSESLVSAAQEAAGERVALLCFERNPSVCHRAVLGARLSELLHLDLRHL